MKNVRFFSNQMALVAVIVVSSVMMMSFKGTSTKKELGFFKKVEQQKHKSVLDNAPMRTGITGISLMVDIVTMTMTLEVCLVGYESSSLKNQKNDKIAQDKKMSAF